MTARLVKRCPTCGAENAPTAVRCACGAFLIGVDLTERADTKEESRRAIRAADEVAATVEGRASTIAAGASSEAKDLPATACAVASEPAPTPMPGSAASRENANTEAARKEDGAPVCGFADCAQPNPPGSTICVYCNRPLDAEPAPARSLTKPIEGWRSDEFASRASLIRLPAKLAARFEIEEPLKAAGGEADLLVVREKSSSRRAVLKLYRHGIEPDTEVLERVSRAAPDQLVHLLEHGRDEGVPYELLEYCEHGSLRAQLKCRPMPSGAARTLLVELTDAIAHLHACGIVHRDLKPENVLIRGLLPLDLVLTDFGIASIAQATMHHTSAARTLRYSAPEAGSNWVGKPTDYWALGMMLIEALTGRHPFEGLSDAVVAHWLVTRAIDVSGIADARWQKLCRGLLTRDPKARWGADEIGRWLDGDDSLAVIDERPAPLPGAASPYRVGDKACRTPRELAVALAVNWAAGVKDLKRGMLRAWLQNDLRDQNLARAAADAEEALEISDDERLLRLLLRLDPELPPVFKGYDISVAGLAALTRKALEDHNEERQTVLEILDRGIFDRFPGSPLQGVRVRFEEAKREFESALDTAFAAGAPRDLAPQGREWQLRMLLFVLEPPKGRVESLQAAAERVGRGAAQRCDWYRALGDLPSAGPATLAAMVLLGPPAAQQGMAALRESAGAVLRRLSMTIDSNAHLLEAHGEARERLARTVEGAQDEEAVLALPARTEELSRAIECSLAALLRDAVFESRPIAETTQLTGLRRRIGEWARWRAGEAWAGFGAEIVLRSAAQRRSYRLQLTTQIEMRRVPYKYGAADVARMPARAKATLDDVWSCAMPALPQFAADLKIARAQDMRCARCGAGGRVELQESWGSAAYPFSTTFACHDKVGVQCQTRLAWAAGQLPPAGVPSFVADFIDAHAAEPDAAERTLEWMAPRIPSAWIEAIASKAVRDDLAAKLAAVAQELPPHERVGAQRLRIEWNGLAEVRYRYRDKDYVIWIPERADAMPIALEHPLPSAMDAHSSAGPSAGPASPASEERRDSGDSEGHAAAGSGTSEPAARSLPRWLRMLMHWGAVLILAVCSITWMVNWKP